MPIVGYRRVFVITSRLRGPMVVVAPGVLRFLRRFVVRKSFRMMTDNMQNVRDRLQQKLQSNTTSQYFRRETAHVVQFYQIIRAEPSAGRQGSDW